MLIIHNNIIIVARGAWECEGCSGRAGEEMSSDKDVKWIMTNTCLLFQWLGRDEIKPGTREKETDSPGERVLFVCVQSEKVKAESLTALILFHLFLYFMNNKRVA